MDFGLISLRSSPPTPHPLSLPLPLRSFREENRELKLREKRKFISCTSTFLSLLHLFKKCIKYILYKDRIYTSFAEEYFIVLRDRLFLLNEWIILNGCSPFPVREERKKYIYFSELRNSLQIEIAQGNKYSRTFSRPLKKKKKKIPSLWIR